MFLIAFIDQYTTMVWKDYKIMSLKTVSLQKPRQLIPHSYKTSIVRGINFEKCYVSSIFKISRKLIFAIREFLKNFAGINFRESTILKNFAGINFRESAFSGVKKGIYFREFGQNSRNFLPAKISSLKVVAQSERGCPKWK